MDVQRLRQLMKLIPMVHDVNKGPEFLFTQKVKNILPKTNFELLGEQLIVGKDNNIGKCDLWLVNEPSNFLVSLELKVGDKSNLSKQKFLKTQVYKYTDYMKYYFNNEKVYGFGAYQCTNDNHVKFVDYVSLDMPLNHLKEIDLLKCKIAIASELNHTYSRE